ncbi:hypothetical protein BJ684DRAFT_14867 [Piptocephalis cylindrospora]|uniref:G-protein coupled receptors family 2 profile 2 domain-containing protein n=1 Tax=Piptocephalis cylindrospora TaxID=1907219 RepID=A0A4P9Y9X7_9FUNG|nr:hypothetical protein BJ684DRAFT_14867 [Piptocephalis cylindrospora]|eukprot:RKP14840.1 hypothetical protein BJ684DRAFT_14867 [Piptocephalis cylindrospora]
MPDGPASHILGGVSTTEQFYIRATCIPLNIISLIACVLVLLAYTAARIYRPQLTDRVSLRLTIGLTVADLLFASFQIIGLSPVRTNTSLCAASVWGYVASSLLATFLTVCLAFNLHVVFVSGARNTHSYERWYFLVSLLAAVLISLAPFIGKRYGFDDKEQTCWFRDVESGIGLLWAWLTLYLWVILGILYCTLAVSVILLHLHRGKRKMQHRQIVGIPTENDSTGPESPPSKEERRPSVQGRRKNVPALPPSPNAIVLNRIVTRLIMYPVVLVVAQSLNVAVEMSAFDSGSYNFPLYLASFIATSSQGLLNSLVFLVDPAVRTCWRCVRRDLIKNYGMDYNPSQPPRRHPWFAAILHWWVKVWLVRVDEEIGQDPSPSPHPSPPKQPMTRPGVNGLGKGTMGRVNPSVGSSRPSRRDGAGRFERVPGRLAHPIHPSRRAFPVAPGPSRLHMTDKDLDRASSGRGEPTWVAQGEEGRWYGTPAPIPKALVRDLTHDTMGHAEGKTLRSLPSSRSTSQVERPTPPETRWFEGVRVQSKPIAPSQGKASGGKERNGENEEEEEIGMTGQIVILDSGSQNPSTLGDIEAGQGVSGSAEQHRLAMALI